MNTPQVDTESNTSIQNTPPQLVAQIRCEDSSNVVRIAIALTLDVIIDDQTVTPRISNIAVLSTKV